MKFTSVWMLCLSLTFLAGCQPDKRICVEVIVSEGSPPVFRFGDDENFGKPMNIWHIAVRNDKDKENSIYWVINTKSLSEIPLLEVVYGVVPEGFEESSRKARPLEPNVRYSLEVWVLAGSVEFENVIVYFTYKPGRYFGCFSGVSVASRQKEALIV